MTADPAGLYTLTTYDQGRSLRLPGLRVSVTLPDKRVLIAPLDIHPIVLGSSDECDLVLCDPRVSRKHTEIRLTDRGVLLRDLDSKNGTVIRGVPILEALLPPSVPVTLGGSELILIPSGGSAVVPLSSRTTFGDALGPSLPMRSLFAKLERASPTDETILLLGESGTGKEVLSRAIHAHSRRKDGPFVVVDCGAIAPNLIEGELFGYVRGAFTGADKSRAGLLEQANGGTLFIDELGELPLDLQPKLLRVIESKQIRRLGSNDVLSFDARVIAATHRNLRARASSGAFREDLYYRLAVVEVHVPALRERKEDIGLLVERFLQSRDPPRSLAELPPDTLSLLESYDWPGNVRELRNMAARMLLFPELIPELMASVSSPPPPEPRRDEGARAAPPVKPGPAREPAAEALGSLVELRLHEAREVVVEQFDRRYLPVKLEQHGGNVSKAAEAMGVSRQLVHRLIERYGLRVK